VSAFNRKNLIGLVAVSVFFVSNHLVFYFQNKQMTARNTGTSLPLVVRMEKGVYGHNTIGIDESGMSTNTGLKMLFFSTLSDWAYQPDGSVPCPKVIHSLSGREFSCTGFMYPLEAGKKIKVFCLLRSTQTCCYGPRPQYNQYLLVECAEPVVFERFAPVTVHGKFIVDPKPSEGYIYRMEADAVESAASEAPQINAASLAGRLGLPLFSFDLLAKISRKNNLVDIPPELQALDGRTVVIDGFSVGRTKGAVPGIIIGKEWWDGVSQGTPPTLYNAIIAVPGDQKEAPPLWQMHVVMSGTLKITGKPADWPTRGIVRIENAVAGVDETGNNAIFQGGAFLPFKVELIILIVFLLWLIISNRVISYKRKKILNQ